MLVFTQKLTINMCVCLGVGKMDEGTMSQALDQILMFIQK